MRPDGPIAADRAETPVEVEVLDARIFYPFAPPTELPVPARQPSPGLLHRAFSEVVRAVMDGFAFCAQGMYPELFCRAEEPADPDPDALVDDAPRSWRSDMDVELHRIVSLHRFRG